MIRIVSEGKVSYINPEHVVCIDEADGGCTILMDNEVTYEVKGKIEDVVEILHRVIKI